MLYILHANHFDAKGKALSLQGRAAIVSACGNKGGILMNLDDKSLFLDAMEDVQPLKRHSDVHWAASAQRPNPPAGGYTAAR